MNQNDYMAKLLSLCTDKQKNLWSKMYPDGPTPKQMKWGISQLENTLKGLNESKEELASARKELAEYTEKSNTTIRELENKLCYSQKETEEANRHIERLENPISTANNKIQERLELLDALEAGGVDNWMWYDESISNHRNR